MRFAICTPWHDEKVFNEFCKVWSMDRDWRWRDDPIASMQPEWFFPERDEKGEGCAVTKNKAIRRALDAGAEYIIVLDSDCHPHHLFGPSTLEKFAEEHIKALEPQEVEMFSVITNPPSRGTPYFNRTIKMPVAASMGFWEFVYDYDAVHQLAMKTHGMTYQQQPIYGKYFAFSGMNYAFHRDWAEWVVHIDVPRYDDIWMGLRFQKEAYAKGYCFNLNGPVVWHSRQSNVWENLKQEAQYLEENETRWQRIHRGEI